MNAQVQFQILRMGLQSQPELLNEFELAYAAIASKHHPSGRAERFVFGGACEWLLSITAWKAGVKSIPGGHGQNGFDLMQFKESMQGLWSLKSSAATKASGDINLRNNISSSTKATSAIYAHPTVFLGPYLPGLTFVDFSTNPELAAKINYDKDASKIKSKEILNFALGNPDSVITANLKAVKGKSVVDENLEIVANILTSGTYDLLKNSVEVLRSYSNEITVLRDLHTRGNMSDEEFDKNIQKLSLE
jgi:hypothetical protein